MILPTPEEADFTAYPWGMVIDKRDVARTFVLNPGDGDSLCYTLMRACGQYEASDFAF